MTEFSQFYTLEGTLFKLQNCIVPNPVTTACFWGAVAFVVGFVWVAVMLRKPLVEKPSKKLWWFLLACTLFAWGNFARQLWLYTYKPGSSGQCFAGTGPWQSACFYGSVLFLLTFIASTIFVYKKSSGANLK